MNLARAKLAAFLNKKSWHTGGMPMQAEVWKREQEKAHEARKVEEMKREIAEERKMQELTDQAAEAGHVQKLERLEFMYKGGPGMGGPGMGVPGMGVPSEDADAYLMGEKRFEAPGGDDALSRARDAPGSLLAAHPEAAKNETWNKLNSDPLLTMRVQEQEARRAITRNPAEAARAREIRKALERRRGEKKEKRRARKEEKKAAKRARKEKIRLEVRREVLGENAETASRGRSRDVDLPGRKREGRRRSRGSSASSSDSDSDSGSDSRRRGGKRARPRSRSRSRDADHRSFRNDRSRRDDRSFRNVNDRRRREDGGRESPRRSPRSRSPPLAARDGASAQDGSKGYGLTYANARGERAAAVRRERRDEWRERARDTREAEDEAARVEKREKEARWASRAKNGGARNTVGHETGKVSDSERAARLAAMSSDAAAHDASRVSRLREGAERDAARGEKSLGRLAASAPERHHSEAAPFLEKAQREAFGGGVGKDSLEDRIGTTKYYTRRGGGDDDDA